MQNKYNLPVSEITENEYKLVLHSLIEKAAAQQCKLIGVSTSLRIKNEKEKILFKTADLMNKMKYKVAVINFDQYCNLDNLCKNASFRYFSFAEKPGQETLGQLRNEYDYILINFPPLMLFAEAMFFTKNCDAVILTEKYGSTRHNNFEALQNELKNNNIKLLGVIAAK